MKTSERVQAGAAALDEVCGVEGSPIPCNWREQIDLKTLELHSTEFCILGQLGEGDFWGTLDEIARVKSIETKYDWAEEHGFNNADSPGTFRGLTMAWKSYLRRWLREHGRQS